MDILMWIIKQIIFLGAAASIIVLLILLVKKIFYNALSPKWHYYIWILLLIRLLVPVYPQSSLSIYNLFYSAGEKMNLPVNAVNNSFKGSYVPVQEISVDKESNSSQKDALNNENTNNAAVSNGNTSAASLQSKKTQKYNLALIIMALIWILGVLELSLYTIYINIGFAVKVHKKYTLLKDERINSILENCRNIMNIKRPIPLFTSKKLRTPSLYGFFNPKILISAAYMEKLTDAEIKYIFLHELSHYKRKDIAVNWIIALLQIVYFFNPLIWYAFYKMHQECEISCDAEALKYVNEEEYQSYGSTIIKLVKLFSESNFIPVTAGICKNKSSYKRRIIMISKFKKSKWTNTLLALVLIIAIGLVGLSGCKSSGGKDSSGNNTNALSSPAADTKNTVTTTPTSTPAPTSASNTTGTVKTKSAEPTAPAKTSTATATPTAIPAASSSAQVYKNSNLKLSITFPASWNGKYRVKETNEGIYVYFVPKEKIPDGQGFFFCILKKTADLDESHYDSINGKKEITVNGIIFYRWANRYWTIRD